MAKYLEDHRIVVKKMSWCDLAGTIIEMELEMLELAPYFNKREAAKRQKVLEIYEKEKAYRVASQSQGTDYAKFLFDDDDLSD